MADKRVQVNIKVDDGGRYYQHRRAILDSAYNKPRKLFVAGSREFKDSVKAHLILINSYTKAHQTQMVKELFKSLGQLLLKETNA